MPKATRHHSSSTILRAATTTIGRRTSRCSRRPNGRTRSRQRLDSRTGNRRQSSYQRLTTQTAAQDRPLLPPTGFLSGSRAYPLDSGDASLEFGDSPPTSRGPGDTQHGRAAQDSPDARASPATRDGTARDTADVERRVVEVKVKEKERGVEGCEKKEEDQDQDQDNSSTDEHEGSNPEGMPSLDEPPSPPPLPVPAPADVSTNVKLVMRAALPTPSRSRGPSVSTNADEHEGQNFSTSACIPPPASADARRVVYAAERYVMKSRSATAGCATMQDSPPGHRVPGLGHGLPGPDKEHIAAYKASIREAGAARPPGPHPRPELCAGHCIRVRHRGPRALIPSLSRRMWAQCS
ncbi:hypothetical protein EVJ58_g7298 [Rhodofomes roseus]|uniref:Uncharacterized protein n=1 Tax=Rhodofomes roseus TaxID=34475 RepID=A0A4Y9Y472_9APHY|nr:hypothetical protein EVJ58_g7298 [Rhodofomes roseus]